MLHFHIKWDVIWFMCHNIHEWLIILIVNRLFRRRWRKMSSVAAPQLFSLWEQCCAWKSPLCSFKFSSCSVSLRHIVIVDFPLFPWQPAHCLPLCLLAHLPPSLPRLRQSKQEAGGLCCDVVRVEVEESLTKEQLLETFITCGESRDTNANTQRQKGVNNSHRCRRL